MHELPQCIYQTFRYDIVCDVTETKDCMKLQVFL